MASGMLDGKVVVVTGAGGGIGREFATAMAANGARVVVNDIGASVSGEGRDAGPAQQVVDAIQAAGGEAVANTDSVADWDAAARIVQCALDHFGRIDAVVNNAGILRDRFFFNMSLEEWRAVIDVHLNGSFYVARARAVRSCRPGRTSGSSAAGCSCARPRSHADRRWRGNPRAAPPGRTGSPRRRSPRRAGAS
jgi:NAD(P)-dependent dehydrogenase (short-subunit alcohol dehydrogenase family)